jgi:hypothetical protein
LYKNKTVLIEAIHKSKTEKQKADKLEVQQRLRREKNEAARKRKQNNKLAAQNKKDE